ncbi:MAG: V-type ATP synthase subunit A [Candidatus Kaelpia imicola]|nr:V-type ATP synthase subunit A [Candidatus Kaelpia imicola]
MKVNRGSILSISGNMITVKPQSHIMQNELGYVLKGEQRLKAEVIKIRGEAAYMQVFEDTKGLRVGDEVEFSNQLLSVELGPGLLGSIYDGLQNPLNILADEYGFFLPRGVDIAALDLKKRWHFTPLAKEGDLLLAGNYIGYVEEEIFKHYIMVPFDLSGEHLLESLKPEGNYSVKDTIATVKDRSGNSVDITMSFRWPIRVPITSYRKRLQAIEPLTTRIRIIDTFFPVAKGGTYCIPGPFGAGKTVLQQLTSRYAEVDIVIIAACGERAGEVVETLREFPKLKDDRTGKSLMARTIIICNTSSMPVAARDASVYTAATLGEYYRQMGLDVLLLADSTSRWAQAMREVSGRLEEIPGEEAFPAYLESRIAAFYERSGVVELLNGESGSLTIGGTVSPAGGNFEEPVTQSTLKVVGAFHGLSRERSDARKYPSISPLESWSKYRSFIVEDIVAYAKEVIFKGDEVFQMMKVVGEEGVADEDFLIYLKSEFLDYVYLQQNGYDRVDAATPLERQDYVFSKADYILRSKVNLETKDELRAIFFKLRQMFLDWNYTKWNSSEFKSKEKEIDEFIKREVLKKDEEAVQQDR